MREELSTQTQPRHAIEAGCPSRTHEEWRGEVEVEESWRMRSEGNSLLCWGRGGAASSLKTHSQRAQDCTSGEGLCVLHLACPATGHSRKAQQRVPWARWA